MTSPPQFLTLMATSENGHPIKVVDAVDQMSHKAYMRCIMDERGGVYSAINLTGERRQPFLVAIQDVIDGWGLNSNPTHAVVLGCAGCAIPRYLLSTFSSIMVDGVEISSQLVSIAKKYFLEGVPSDRFSLITSDAVTYCASKDISSRFDLIVSDLFDGHRVLDEIYSIDFMSSIQKMMNKDRGLFVANLSGVGNAALSHIVQSSKELFYQQHVIRDRKRVYLIAYSSPNAVTNELQDTIIRYSDSKDRDVVVGKPHGMNPFVHPVERGNT